MKLVFIIFSLVMIVTRFPFGGGVLHLLDVSWALFFILGRFQISSQSKLMGFGWFVLLGWVIDLIATEGAIVGSYCMTPAYLGMPIAYGALTLAGHLSSGFKFEKASSAAAIVVVGVGLGALAAFIISNAFFYQLSGYFEHMSVGDFSRAVVHYFPSYFLTAQLYVLGWFCLDRALSLDDKVARSLNGVVHD